jgi:hypothetical protein
MLITVDSQTAIRLLRIYGIHPPVTDEHFGHDGDLGTSITIDGVNEPEKGPSIRLKIGGRRKARACPIAADDAERLVAEFHDENVLPADAKTDRTLVHLLTKCCKLYMESGINELHLVLYITPTGYRTHAVYMLRTRTIAKRGSTGTIPVRAKR